VASLSNAQARVTKKATPAEVGDTWKISGYFSRWNFVLERCRGRSVLHLGCIGETDASPEDKLQAFRAKRVLHPHLVAAAREVIGVDIDADAVDLLRSELGLDGMVVADVEHLDRVELDRTFEIILCGDLLEHLSSPGLVLHGVRRFMKPASELIVSVPNPFGLLANLRFTLGRFRDGAQHVAAFSKFNLVTLLERHGLQITELYTCFDRPPFSGRRRLVLGLGIPFFRYFPERGGTLLCVARLTQTSD
jgi:SAM-dependent methyltransferase